MDPNLPQRKRRAVEGLPQNRETVLEPRGHQSDIEIPRSLPRDTAAPGIPAPQKTLANELAQMAALLEAAGEISGVGGWEYDLLTHRTLWTKQTRRIHEVDDTFDSNLENGLQFYPSETVNRLRLYLQKAAELEERFHFITPFRTAKGREIIVEVAGVPWVVEGRIERIIGVIRDITKEQEDEAQLRKAKEDAEAANLAKSQFLATMSHEIRTPLNAILGFAQILKEDPDSRDREEFLELIDSNGRILSELISDILDFARIEAGADSLEKVPVNIRGWIDEQMILVRELAREAGLSLASSVDDTLADYWLLDPLRLSQVVINLLRNAIKFTAIGYVHLAVKPALEGGLEFSVSDSGIGIPEDKLETIFEIFAQVDSSTTRKYGGTGIGLAICRRLVDLMRGQVWAESALGSGSTFFVRVPAEPAKTYEAIPPGGDGCERSQSGPEEQPAEAVLLVEDNPTNQMVMQAIIQRSGFSAVTAENGQLALDACRQHRYNLVFMDLHMPVMDGLNATRQIKADGAFGQPRVVVFSASVQPSDRQASFEAGADYFLSKPVSLEEMRTLLNRWGRGGNPPEDH